MSPMSPAEGTTRDDRYQVHIDQVQHNVVAATPV
ncbi:hypothetical protein MY10362_009671, partial [Beauveria mimosiformis]